MRDRLIELLNKYMDGYKGYDTDLADYLLANGVVVPPVKLNDDLWWIDNDDVTIEKQEQAIKGIGFDADGKWYVIDRDKNIDEVGTRYAYLSREEAEQALKGGGKE